METPTEPCLVSRLRARDLEELSFTFLNRYTTAFNILPKELSAQPVTALQVTLIAYFYSTFIPN